MPDDQQGSATDDQPEPASDDQPDTEIPDDAAFMTLEPDAIHEEEDGYSLDCPSCGTTVSLIQIIEDGHCPGYLEADDAEVEADGEQLEGPACTANLWLQLAWSE